MTTTKVLLLGASGIRALAYDNCHYVVKNPATWNPAAFTYAELDGATGATDVFATGFAARILCPGGSAPGIYVTSSTTAAALDPLFKAVEGSTVRCIRSGKTYVQTAATNAATAVFVRGPDTTYPLAVDTAALADGDVNIAYTQTVVASGGVAPYTYAVVGTLPAGLSLNTSTGAITGTPTLQQTARFLVTATDATGAVVSSALSLRVRSYDEKIEQLFGTSLIGYWTQSEPSGTTAIDATGTSTGTYTNVTLAQAGIGDGTTSALYPGTPTVSSTNIFSAALAAKFNPGEMTLFTWAKPAAAEFWTDAATEVLLQLVNGGSTKYAQIFHYGNGTISAQYHGTARIDATGLSGTGWKHLGMTVSVTADGIKEYVNGVDTVDLTGIGTWTDALATATIGNATTPSAAAGFPGYMAKTGIVNRWASKWEMWHAAQVQASGVWTPLGAVIEPSNATLDKQFTGEPNVIPDNNPQILTGAALVYKMWYSAGDNSTVTSIAYAESLTGLPGSWVNYASNPIITGRTRSSGCIRRNGLYYMTCQVGDGTALAVMSSPNGVTGWTTVTATAIVPNASELTLYNSCLREESGTWYIFYEYLTTDGTYLYAQGVATASSPAGPFTRSANNPIITHASSIGATGTCGGPFVYHRPGGKWYNWSHASLVVVPTDIVRFESSDPTGAFTQSSAGLALPRHSPATGWFKSFGQVSDASLVEAPDGGTYMYYSALNTASAQTEIHVAHSPLSIDQICDTNEGIAADFACEMLVNGSFETAGAGGADVFQGWAETASNGAIARTITSGEFHADTCKLAACKFTAGAAVDTRVTQILPDLIPGRVYVISGYARGDGTYAGRIRVQTSAAVDLMPWPTTLTTAEVYAPFSQNFTAPKDGYVLLSCYCPATSGGVAYFDDVSVKQL
jgi:hypothetical protein